jgi:hypothetical protein
MQSSGVMVRHLSGKATTQASGIGLWAGLLPICQCHSFPAPFTDLYAPESR